MTDPKDGAPYHDECILYCVSPKKNMYLSIQVRFKSSEAHYIILYNSTLKSHWPYQ